MSHFVFVLEVLDIFLYVFKHFNYLNVGAAVFRSLKGWKSSCDYRICITSCRSNYTGSKCWVVTAAVLHMKHKSYIKYAGFKFCVVSVRSEHKQYVFRCGKLFVRTVDIHTVLTVIVVIGLISVNGQHRECAYKSQGLSKNIFNGLVAYVFIISRKSKYTLSHWVHDIFAGRLHYYVSHKVCREGPACSQDTLKFGKLAFIRKFTEYKQICSLFKAISLMIKALYQVNNIISSIPKASVARYLFTVFLFKRFNSGYIC